jgi:hypothetical protein
MKTLDELLAGVRDAYKDTHDGRPDVDYSLGYSKGHAAACDVLIPALEEALQELSVHDGNAYCEMHWEAQLRLRKIRGLLELKGTKE